MKWILGIGVALLGVASIQAEPITEPASGMDPNVGQARQRDDGDPQFAPGAKLHKKRNPRGTGAGNTNPCDAPAAVVTASGRGDRGSRGGGATPSAQKRGKNGKGGASSSDGAPTDCGSNPPVDDGNPSPDSNDNSNDNSAGNGTDQGANGADDDTSDLLDEMDLGEQDSLPDDVFPPVNPIGGNEGNTGPDPTGGLPGDGPDVPMQLLTLDVPTDGDPNGTIPEPASLALVGLGLAALAASRRRRD